MVTKSKIGTFVLFAILFIGVLYLYFFYNPSEYGIFPKCLFYSLTGLYCPGCGSQRAAHQLLHGNIIEGLNHNFLIIILAFILTYDFIVRLIANISEKTIKNILHNSKITHTILFLVITFWILRNINIYPFTILAP